MRTSFFDESLEQSRIKAEIVTKYFFAWARIILATLDSRRTDRGRVGYVDLFAGPGRYRSGRTTTALRVLQTAINDPVLADRLVTVFNDKDEEYVRSLQAEIESLDGIDSMRHRPVVWNEDVGDEIVRQFESIKTIPLLAFIDPWGYKGLTLRLVNALLQGWGSDCIFFFNYNRINAGLNNPLVRRHMEALFGPERASGLASSLTPLKPEEREATIVNELAEALKSYGDRYVLPFCFKDAAGVRTAHHLVLVTKNFKGYEVMKDIMAKASSAAEQGVPSFTFLPPTAASQGILFDLSRPLKELQSDLMRRYSGRSLTMRALYVEHSVDRPFLARHYKSVLSSMHRQGVVATDRPPRGSTFADDIQVTFPRVS